MIVVRNIVNPSWKMVYSFNYKLLCRTFAICCLFLSFSTPVTCSHGYLIQPMMSPFYGGRRRRHRRSRRYRSNPRGPSHPSSTAMYDYKKHFLDDKYWMTNKNIRIWSGNTPNRKKPNERSWTGRIILANLFCYALQSFNPKVTQWGVKLSERYNIYIVK